MQSAAVDNVIGFTAASGNVAGSGAPVMIPLIMEMIILIQQLVVMALDLI